MKAASFVEGVALALAAALAGSAMMFALAGVLTTPLLLRVVVTVLALGYVLYLLARTRPRAGKVSALALWALLTATSLALDVSLLVHLCAQVGLICLLRAFCVHRSVLPALADLVLCTASVSAAVWAAERTGSVFMAIWCLLLVQAAYVAIPRRNRSPRGSGFAAADSDARFMRAHRTAQAALRRLSIAS